MSDNLAVTLLQNLVAKKVRENPGCAVSVVSDKYGPVCGFVPDHPVGRTVLQVDDGKVDLMLDKH